MRISPTAALLTLLALAPASLRADETAPESDRQPPRVVAALLGGAASAIVPLAVGGVVFASRDDVPTRQAGLFVAMTGLVAAPLVTHLTTREYRRALYFTIAPFVGSVATSVLMETHPLLFDADHPPVRVVFGAALSVAVLGAIVGIVDSISAGERWRRTHPALAGRF